VVIASVVFLSVQAFLLIDADSKDWLLVLENWIVLAEKKSHAKSISAFVFGSGERTDSMRYR